MKIFLLIAYVLIAVILIPFYVFSAEWYEGGTLHKASIQIWRESTDSNRLATSADWFVSITKSQNPEYKKKMDKLDRSQYLYNLKSHSIQLERCISEMARGKTSDKLIKPTDKIAEIASICYVTMWGIE
jgi:hypothetical protein